MERENFNLAKLIKAIDIDPHSYKLLITQKKLCYIFDILSSRSRSILSTLIKYIPILKANDKK